MLEAAGCVAIMPLASLIGSGMGILNPWNLQLILDKVKHRGDKFQNRGAPREYPAREFPPRV